MIKTNRNINIADFDYNLPEERIAKFPLEVRDASKLLICERDQVSQDVFSHVADHLPAGSLLVFNETKVIQARLVFRKETGARIEIFCLEPVEPHTDFQLAFQERNRLTWKCFVGNSKRWKSGELELNIEVNGQAVALKAERISRSEESSLVSFYWDNPGFTFSEILENSGMTPIPPYLNRQPVESDKSRYQTIYAHNKGSVAAPTAGLHFTDKVFNSLQKKGISETKVTLHVGAGTFKPVVSQTVGEHVMHFEKIIISKATIMDLLKIQPGKIIAVGTTSVRTLESLYWYGLKLMNTKSPPKEIYIEQWDPYSYDQEDLPETSVVLKAILDYMEKEGLDHLSGSTQLMILPGYKYRIIKGMITNFHQPKSTLLLLVAAFLGDKWKEVYQYALDHDFRFLSYGDSCLFL